MNHNLVTINPYWQIMENSSRIFSEIFIFRTQAVLLENSSIFFEISILGRHTGRFTGKLIHFFRNFNSGASHRLFHWKTHPLKIMSTYSVFFNSGASHRPFYWKTHPFEFFDWNHKWYVRFDLESRFWISFPVKRSQKFPRNFDVGDGCWRRNVLVTTFRYWWRFLPFWSP